MLTYRLELMNNNIFLVCNQTNAAKPIFNTITRN